MTLDVSSKSSKSKSSKDSSKSSKSGSSKKGKKGKEVVPPPPDPSIWCDFNKVADYIDTIFIYFKSSHFNLNIRITDLALTESSAKPKPEKDKKSKTNIVKESKTLIWPVKLFEYRNEPLYIFMDTVDTKFLVFSMSQVGCVQRLIKPQKKRFANAPDRSMQSSGDTGGRKFSSVMDILRRLSRQSNPSIPTMQPEEEDAVEKEYIRPFAYFAAEKFAWESNGSDFPLVFLNTFGTQGTLFDFRKGRVLLKIWIRSDTSYILNILSDSPVVIGNMEIISEAMTRESECLIEMCFNVATSFGKLVQKFGTNEYPLALKEFYACYKPDYKLSKSETIAIHRTFVKLLVSLLAENFDIKELEECVFVLRVLFLDPKIDYENKIHDAHSVISTTNSLEDASLTSEDVMLVKYIERSAVLVQAFFKRIYIRQLMSLHKEDNKKFGAVFSTLKKIYMTVFGVQKRLQTCPALLRRLLDSLNIPDCPLQEDLRSVVHLHTFKGLVITASNVWIPICRFTFNVNWYEPVPVRIHLFCEIRNHFVRVFNNDTGEEIPR